MAAGKKDISRPLWLVFAASLLFPCVSFPQEPVTKGVKVTSTDTTKKTGATFALVTGISLYEDKTTYPPLHYADKDARVFYNYLVSKTGGGADPANVDTLFNEKASFMEFWRKFNRIKSKLQPNDLFYIYFSGHGDAYRADEAYLLAYDAPAGNDPNNYSTGVGLIDVHKLKVRIEEMTGNGIRVILITDACRSNELPGRDQGKQVSYQQIFERKAGEIQLISCASNQVSFEGDQWGGGRGLFSWHLINGLKGMADTDPEDGEVTLTELYDYTKKKVNSASYDPRTKEYRQTPQYCCSNFDNFVLSHVDKTEKEKLAEALENPGNTYTDPKTMIAQGKGLNLGAAMKAAGYEDLYQQFVKAMNEGRLIDSNGAYDILKKILVQKNISEELASELKFELSSRLMSDVTRVINIYLQASINNNKYTYDFFMTAARKLRVFREIADTLYYTPLDVKVNLLFLEGHANWRAYKTPVLQESLRKADSAIALKPQAAYLYNLKGLMHLTLRQFSDAEKAFRKGIALAPNWLYPLANLASYFTNQGQYDSAYHYYNKALQIDSNYHSTYSGFGAMYIYKGDYDSAIYYYKKGLQKDPGDPVLWTQLGYAYYWKKDWTQALQCFYQGIKFDSTFSFPYEGALRVHLYTSVNKDSIQYYAVKMIRIDKTNPIVYKSLGDIYQEFGMYQEAINMYDISVTYDSLNALTWDAAAEAYHRMGKDTLAINCRYYAWTIDSTDGFMANKLALSYFNLGKYTQALRMVAKAIELKPAEPIFYYNYGYISVLNKDSASGELYYLKALEKNSKYSPAWYELARLKALHGRNREALDMLAKAIEYGPYKREDIEKDPAFEKLKTQPGFIQLMEKIKIK